MAVEQESAHPYPQTVSIVSCTVNMDHDGIQGLEGYCGRKCGQNLP